VPMQLTNPNAELEIDSVAATKTGYIVLAGRENKSDHSSLLAFVNPLDRRVVMQVQVELARIAGLAYNPKTGDLYVANSEPENKQSGIFRIDAVENNALSMCKATKIFDAESPTALAFTAS